MHMGVYVICLFAGYNMFAYWMGGGGHLPPLGEVLPP